MVKSLCQAAHAGPQCLGRRWCSWGGWAPGRGPSRRCVKDDNNTMSHIIYFLIWLMLLLPLLHMKLKCTQPIMHSSNARLHPLDDASSAVSHLDKVGSMSHESCSCRSTEYQIMTDHAMIVSLKVTIRVCSICDQLKLFSPGYHTYIC